MPRPRKSRAVVDDDIDAITPCPLPTPTLPPTSQQQQQPEPPSPRTISAPSPPSSPSATTLTPDLPSPVHHISPSSVHSGLRSTAGSSMGSRSRSASPSSDCCDADHVFSSTTTNSRRRDSVRALEEGTDGDPERLWMRMLALQRTYGCYNSARMSAALSSGDVSLLLPSKACLDLLNEHMTLLPDEAERALGDWRFKSQGGIHL
ncbi:hypothetical protein SLS62_002068 [Diatrype stigma]|uniref:Uncharacterized protein n=1 Tax=Diatrype stigma TaxID=117547 RepID=A0AAN9V939_9PEZI